MNAPSGGQPSPPAGYSKTPLAAKLGITAGRDVLVRGAPDDYLQLLEPLPAGVRFVDTPSASTDIVHLFTTRRRELESALKSVRTAIAPTTAIWLSWPKRASGVSTDITEDTIRDVALPLGLVDIKVCAVDATWSGLKLVIRKELR